MTNRTGLDPSPSPAPPVEPVPPPIGSEGPDRDWFLQQLISIVTDSDANLSIGVTLFCGGLVVSGMLVHPIKYFEGFGLSISAALEDQEAGARTAESYTMLGQSIYSQKNGDNPRFIHLSNARIYGGTSKPIPTGEAGTWWRGKVSTVDSFILGTITESRS